MTALLPTGPPVPPAEPLAASFTFSCSDVSCTFDASGSTGSPVTWDWTFGHDGATGSGETVLHDFPAVTGTYTVTLTVGDGSGTDTTTDTVSCKKRGRNGVQCT